MALGVMVAATFVVQGADAQSYYPHEYSGEGAPYPGVTSQTLREESTELVPFGQEALVIPYEAFRVALNSPENQDFNVTIFDEENRQSIREELSSVSTHGLQAEFVGDGVEFDHHLFIVPLDQRFSPELVNVEFQDYLLVAGNLRGVSSWLGTTPVMIAGEAIELPSGQVCCDCNGVGSDPDLGDDPIPECPGGGTYDCRPPSLMREWYFSDLAMTAIKATGVEATTGKRPAKESGWQPRAN